MANNLEIALVGAGVAGTLATCMIWQLNRAVRRRRITDALRDW